MSDERSIEGGGLRVAFWRLADRFAHRVELAPSDLCLLESLEGTADEDWPASPPLQELHFESRGAETQLALLVGRAGASHWSLSIELDAAAAKVTFDVACRIRSAPERLGSSYRLPNLATRPSAAEAFAIELPGECQLQYEATGDQPGCEVVPQAGGILLRPGAIPAAWPSTVRWRYAVYLMQR